MSELNGSQPAAKRQKNRQTSATNKQNGTQPSTSQRLAIDDKEGWKAYWKAQGQPWRTEPEIDTERQKYLTEQRNIIPNIQQGIYPFKNIKLSRADVEWLLATHENGRGPVDWSDENQRTRKGLDLRGAILSRENLNGLPLACTVGGSRDGHVTLEQRSMAAMHMDRVTLRGTHLEGAMLIRANLDGAFLPEAHLEEADLLEAHLERVNFRSAYLGGANLQKAFFDTATNLDGTFLSNADGEGAQLAGTHWGDVDLNMVNWSAVRILGDERMARQKEGPNGQPKKRNARLREHEEAVRANRQLALALQAQGLNEDAARFAYRAQTLQRKVFWYKGQFGQYGFSLFLDLLSGYGYKPARSFLAYLLVISVFATTYSLLGSHLAWNESLVISMTAFHGRGFFPDQFKPGDPQALVAALEAFVGLLIEVTFIATLTQRLFRK